MKRAIVLSLALAAVSPVHGADPAELLRRVDEARNPLKSFVVDVELTSYEKGRTSVSKYRVYGKGSDRSLVEFREPATDKGKFLLMSRDAMWIYLPDTSRPIRISPLQRLSGQASNGDVARTSFTVDYEAREAAEDRVEERDAWRLDLVARDPAVAYKSVRLWIDRGTLQPIMADFSVVSGKRIKRAHYREYGTMARRSVVTLVEIEDLLRPGFRTVMRYSNLQEKDNPEKMFNKESLGKW
ncbi:MAG TPA: outer membrane lipoprotein-sorting protein [Thermoanaerobaculia bacterium]|nr:outer membrane lipoprotein-sorting protein [Thermoanaerobaculia bacterium]